MPAAASLTKPSISASRARLLFYWMLTLGGSLSDLLSKHWVFQWRGNPAPHNEWWIVRGFFGIETSLNNGALFGIGQGFQLVFAGLSVAAFLGILVWLYRLGAADDIWLCVALGLICSGIIGNLYDRLGFGKLPGTPAGFQHAVRDWILFRFGEYTWPNFNLADSYLVCGAGLLVLHSFWLDRK